MAHLGKSLSRLLVLALVLLILPLASLAADQPPQDLYTINTIWVLLDANLPPEQMHYSYAFVEKTTGERFVLDIRAEDAADQNPHPQIFHFSQDIALPRSNNLGRGAVFALSPQEDTSLERDGRYFRVNSAEATSRNHGASYFERTRIFNQQINPQATLVLPEGEVLDLVLTLSLRSWALDDQGKPLTASLERSLPEATSGQAMLFELFGDNPDDASLMRDFTAAELRWDGQAVAGFNDFSLDVQVPAGYLLDITGDAMQGFTITISK